MDNFIITKTKGKIKMIIPTIEEIYIARSRKNLEAILNDPKMKIIPKERRILNNSNLDWLLERCNYPLKDICIDQDTRYEIKKEIQTIRLMEKRSA